MKKNILIILMLFILSSCLVVSRDEIKAKQNPRNVEVDNVVATSGVSSGKIIKEETNSGEILEEEPAEIQEKIPLSIEEQYCVSKGGKIVSEGNRKICYTTDDKGLLKCDVKIFYFDMCRSDGVTVENGVIVGLKKIKNIIKKEESKEETDTGSLKFELGEENLDEVVEAEIIEEESNEVENLYEEKDTPTDTLSQGKIIKEKQGKSGKYFILVGDDGSTDLRMISNEGANISLYKGNHHDGVNRVVIYDYELMINKQIKVFYRGSEDKKLEKIVDLNNL